MCLGGGGGARTSRIDARIHSQATSAVRLYDDADSRTSLGGHIKRSQEPNILIIGAGAAGIACATKLLEFGFKRVRLLEAENRIGGRIHTIPFGDNTVDMGAQWVHGEINNVVYGEVEHMNLLETSGDAYVTFQCIRSNGEVMDDALKERLKCVIADVFLNRGKDLAGYKRSFGEYLDEKFFEILKTNPKYADIDQQIAKEFLENFKKVETAETAVSLNEVSAYGFMEYWHCDGDYMLNWKDRGFVEFLRLLMKSNLMKKELGVLEGKVIFNTTVDRIVWNRSDAIIEVKCKNFPIPYRADHVIVTVSLGVLKSCSDRMFVPALPPEKTNAINGLSFGSVLKVYLEFPVKFWPDDWTGFTILWRENDLPEIRESTFAWVEDVFGFYTVSYQPRLLEIWMIGNHIPHVEKLPIEEVENQLMYLLNRFLHEWEIPKPTSIVRSQWHTNRNFLGTYSFRVLKTEISKAGATELAQPLTVVSYAPAFDVKEIIESNDSPLALKPVVQFAGEATSTHYFSTVHGAVESGWREANRLDGYYSRSQN